MPRKAPPPLLYPSAELAATIINIPITAFATANAVVVTVVAAVPLTISGVDNRSLRFESNGEPPPPPPSSSSFPPLPPPPSPPPSPPSSSLSAAEKQQRGSYQKCCNSVEYMIGDHADK
jgi:hypothetical protein